MTMQITDFYRLDPLTESHNLLSFVETLDSISAQEQKPQLSILYADLNYFYALNEKRGHAYGDSVIRWLGIVLQEESNSPTFRIGGDDFAVILTDGDHGRHEELLHRIYARLNRGVAGPFGGLSKGETNPGIARTLFAGRNAPCPHLKGRCSKST